MTENSIINDWFNVILDNSPEAIIALKAIRDKDGAIEDLQYLFSNKKASESDLAGKLFTKEFPGPRRSGLFELYVSVIESGEPWAGEIHNGSDGSNSWSYVSVARLEDSCIVSYTDITARKRSEEKMKQQTHFIEQVMAMAPDIITVLELSTLKLLYSNEQNLAFHGFDRTEMQNMTIEERRQLIHPEDRSLIDNFFATFHEKILDSEVVTCEYRAKNAAGEWLWFCVRGKVFERDGEGIVISIVNMIQNITDRKMAELKIKSNRDLLEGITGIIPDMISLQSYPGREMIFYNRHPCPCSTTTPVSWQKCRWTKKTGLYIPTTWKDGTSTGKVLKPYPMM